MDREETNKKLRYFSISNPTVSNIIEYYSGRVLCTLTTSGNKDVDDFFNNQIEEIDLFNKIFFILKEFWTFGEAGIYLNLSEMRGRWSEIIIQNPDYVIVKSNPVGFSYSLRPDAKLRNLVFHTINDDDIKIDKKTITLIREGKNLPLDELYFTFLAKRKSPYELRGTSIFYPAFDLLEAYSEEEDILKKTELDKEIKTAIGYPGTYLGDQLSKQRIMGSKLMIKDWLRKKVFAPLSKMNDFYCFKNGTKTLVVPDIEFVEEKNENI